MLCSYVNISSLGIFTKEQLFFSAILTVKGTVKYGSMELLHGCCQICFFIWSKSYIYDECDILLTIFINSDKNSASFYFTN